MLTHDMFILEIVLTKSRVNLRLMLPYLCFLLVSVSFEMISTVKIALAIVLLIRTNNQQCTNHSYIILMLLLLS